jgi:hypothetical protein
MSIFENVENMSLDELKTILDGLNNDQIYGYITDEFANEVSIFERLSAEQALLILDYLTYGQIEDDFVGAVVRQIYPNEYRNYMVSRVTRFPRESWEYRRMRMIGFQNNN